MSLITNIICDDFALFAWSNEQNEKPLYFSETVVSNNKKIILSSFGIKIEENDLEDFKKCIDHKHAIDIMDKIVEKSYDFHKLNFAEIDQEENKAERQIMISFFNNDDAKYYNYCVSFSSAKKIKIVKHSSPMSLEYICAGNYFVDLNTILQLRSLRSSLSQIAVDFASTPKQKIIKLVKITKQAYDVIYSFNPDRVKFSFFASVKDDGIFVNTDI